MKKRTLTRMIRWVALALALVLFSIPMTSVTAIEPRASYYIDSYQASVYVAGSGRIQVWFDITGVDYMDELGALYIYIYESKDNVNWTYVKTFSHVDNSNMLLENDIYHMDHVTYQGVAGRYYKAYVCIWAGKDGGGDSRYLWTSVKKAT